jgi:hypothetical protein
MLPGAPDGRITSRAARSTSTDATKKRSVILVLFQAISSSPVRLPPHQKNNR